MENFITNRQLIEKYGRDGVLRKKAAKKAMKWVLDEYASMTDRFALICMAFIYPEKILVHTGGNPEYMSEKQYNEWRKIMRDAEKSAALTPEGAMLKTLIYQHGGAEISEMSQNIKECMGRYRSAICRQEWKKMFKPRNGSHEYKFAEEISEELEKQEATMPMHEFLYAYYTITDRMPVKPGITREEIAQEVSLFVKQRNRQHVQAERSCND